MILRKLFFLMAAICAISGLVVTNETKSVAVMYIFATLAFVIMALSTNVEGERQ